MKQMKSKLQGRLRSPLRRVGGVGAAAFVFIATATWLLAALASTAAPSKALATDTATLKRGAAVYTQNCATCHGLKGKGEGPIARSYNPPPTDFTKGEFRHGDSDTDILKAINFGIPGTGMTAWKGRLSDADITAVASFIRSLKK